MSAFESNLAERAAPIHYDEGEYGAMANNLPDHGEEKYYLTTAIAYTNGYPHIGHAYEFLTADVLVRYHRALGKDTFFLTGTDEHGQKVAASAEKAGRTPIEHCDHYFTAFQALHKKLLVTYSDFLRTTDPYHELTSQRLWERCAARDDIYLDAYEGWYNEREEVFVSNSEAEACGFKDVGSGLPLKRVTEESYFFRMSKYTEALIQHIQTNPSFIEPENHRNTILSRLQKEGLKDLSVSRTSFTWGIPLPPNFSPQHVMYVWFDALSNYLTGVHALDEGHSLGGYWPAQHHIIGKDIVWFHCVIWPAMLMSAQLPLPKSVFSHGFVNAADGRKMSKSYNNTVDPMELLERFSVDTVRYYCCASITYGADINFSEETMTAMHNSELADILGNLVHRVLNLAVKYCDGKVPDCGHDPQFALPFDLAALKNGVAADIAQCSINTAVFKAMEAARATNRFLTEAEPWKMKADAADRRKAIVRTSLEALYAFSHFLSPVLPVATQRIFSALNSPPRSACNLRDDFYNLTPGTPITMGEILFKKIEDAASAPPVPKAPAPKVVEYEHSISFTKLDLRVGQIVKVWEHPTSDRLYCEEIDIGDGPTVPFKQVASGIRAHYTQEQLLGRKVVVVCNLKEAKLQGFMSYAMVLAAKEGDKLELLEPPADAVVGESIFLPGHEAAAGKEKVWAAAKIKKMKVWEEVSVHLSVNEQGVALYQDLPLSTTAGVCRTPTLVNSKVLCNYTDREVVCIAFNILLNSIVAPSMSIAFVTSTCYYNAIIAAGKVSDTYTTVQCGIIVYQFNNDLCFFPVVIEHDIGYEPPFTYSYVCSSTINMNYIPVYIYMYRILGLLLPVIKVLLHYFNHKIGEESVIIWWRRVLDFISNDQFRHLTKRKHSDMFVFFQRERLAVRLSTALGVLLSFGVIYLLFALIIGVVGVNMVVLEQIFIGCTYNQLDSTTAIYSDYMKKLWFECKNMGSLFMKRMYLIMPFCLAVLGYVVYDIIGYEKGPYAGILPVCLLVIIPFFVVIVLYIWYEYCSKQSAIALSEKKEINSEVFDASLFTAIQRTSRRLSSTVTASSIRLSSAHLPGSRANSSIELMPSVYSSNASNATIGRHISKLRGESKSMESRSTEDCVE